MKPRKKRSKGAIWKQCFPDQAKKLHPEKVVKETKKALYVVVRRWQLKKYPHCALCGRLAEHAHHVVPRSVRRDLVVDRMNLISVCSACHDKIHRNPKWSYAIGWLKKAHEVS